MANREQFYILAVDDDPDALELYAEVLEPEGYRLVKANNGADALEKVRSTVGQPYLIFLDLMMPRMDGLEFVRRKRRDPVLADVPVVFVSAIADRHRLPERPDIKAWLPKPVDIKELRGHASVWESLARLNSPDPLLP